MSDSRYLKNRQPQSDGNIDQIADETDRAGKRLIMTALWVSADRDLRAFS